MGTWLFFWAISAIVTTVAAIFANPGLWLFAFICIVMVIVIVKQKKNGK